MVTWIPSIYPLYVSICASTMDPMGPMGSDKPTSLIKNQESATSVSGLVYGNSQTDDFRNEIWARQLGTSQNRFWQHLKYTKQRSIYQDFDNIIQIIYNVYNVYIYIYIYNMSIYICGWSIQQTPYTKIRLLDDGCSIQLIFDPASSPVSLRRQVSS